MTVARYLTLLMPDVSGSLWILLLYDVCEEIRLEALREILNLPGAGREPVFRHSAPEYVRFERPPLVERLNSFELDHAGPLKAEIDYYEYGVVSVKLQLPFKTDWPELIRLASRWISAPELEARVAPLLRERLDRARTALIKPTQDWLTEDYCVIHLESTSEKGMAASDLIARHGTYIAQVVRGETEVLSPEEQEEILRSRMSYYSTDLLVVGWSAAFIYDTAEGAAPAIQLLEYANTQLLEFRYYDQVLTRVLADVYKSVERLGPVARWRLATKAQELNAIRLDVRELTERIDTSIKFLSDMFSARSYRLAAARVGVEDYRRLVEDKLRTAADLYQFMMDQFHQVRGFVLELMVVIILIIDLVFLFRGKG